MVAYDVPKSRQSNLLIPRDHENATAYQTDLVSGTFDKMIAELENQTQQSWPENYIGRVCLPACFRFAY